jgi:hypothetical protein
MGFDADEIILKDGQLTSSDLLIFPTRTFKAARIEYGVLRADLIEFGEIYLSYNRFANTVKITTTANFDDTGVLFCATVDRDFVRLIYTSTATGVFPIFKHSITYFGL